MPLVRAEVRNEFALGGPELYREARKEEPKEILEGVAVAGLVGVLRQLGDLAEFAAEVFHGLQEEVTITTARSHKLMTRVRRIDISLSPLEKALLAQRSHLHFAYTAGSNWHTRIRCEQNHFIYSDVPQFIMESYEDCRHPPCLHLLDRFDPGGSGSCLKRYSDPTFFKCASVASGEASIDKISKEKKKGRKTKKKSWPRNGEILRDASFSYSSGRLPFTQQSIGGQISPSQTASIYDATLRSDFGEQSNLDSRNMSGYIEVDFRPSYSLEPESRDSISSAVKRQDNDSLDCSFIMENGRYAYDDTKVGTQEQARCSSFLGNGNTKREPFEPTLHASVSDELVQEDRHLESFSLNLDMETPGDTVPDFVAVDKMETQSGSETVREPKSGNVHLDDIESETDFFLDALNTIESECETDIDSTKKQVVDAHSQLGEKGEDGGACECKRLGLECQSLSPASNVLASSPLINGTHNPRGHSIISMPQNFSYATDLVNEKASPKDELHSVLLMNEDLQSSQRIRASASAGSPKSSDSNGNDNIDSRKYVKCVPFTVTSSFGDGGTVFSNFGDGESIPVTDGTRGSPESNERRIFELNRHSSEFQSSSPESNVMANIPVINGHNLISKSPKSFYTTDCFTKEVSLEDDMNSISLLNKDLQSSQRTGDPVSPSCRNRSDSIDNSNIDAGIYVESVESTLSSNLGDVRPELVTDRTRSPESDKHVPELSNATAVTFWTNGSLLGLQPSKPPECSVLNALPRDSEYNKHGNFNSSIQHFVLSDKSSGQQNQPVTSTSFEEDLDMNTSCHEYQESGTTFRKASWKISPSDLEINLEKLGDSVSRRNAVSTGSSITAPGSVMPVNAAHQEKGRSSSGIFGLRNRLLSTGSDEKSLPGVDNNAQSANNKNADDFELKNRRSVVDCNFSGPSKDLFGGKCPILSPSQSPPLEHMKIFFQPINGLECSRLKLKFPDGMTNNGSGSDIYPSFQLVPEVSIPRFKVGSDSEADTFYRSSPSLSGDCHSNLSESNSEQWESSESPTSKDCDLYDALRRISLTESVTAFPANGRANQDHIHGNLGLQFPFVENGLQDSKSCLSFDLQSLSTINNSFRKELRNDTNPKDHVEPHLLPSNTLPSLPPPKWRGMLPIENEVMRDGSYYDAFDLARPASAISQPKPAPFNEDRNNIPNMQKSKPSSQKLYGQREANQGKRTDENDFLHQIRTKSFNLRPTATARSTVPSGAPAAIQVNAILEKANAIRQAVASDAEDDGNWSDT